MNCRMCRTPLKPTQGVYCSKPCQYRGQIAPRQRQRCAMCPRMLTSRQIGKRQRFCSVLCSRAAHVETTPMQDALLSILRSNRDWFLTVSDMAIWLYGDDAKSDLDAIRIHICALRKRGFQLEMRVPVWQRCHGTTRAYRLFSEPSAARWRAA